MFLMFQYYALLMFSMAGNCILMCFEVKNGLFILLNKVYIIYKINTVFNSLHQMLFFVTSFLDDIQVFNFTNTTKTYYYEEIYPSILRNNSETVQEIVDSLSNYNLNSNLSEQQFNVCTTRFCQTFTSIINATPLQYYTYQILIENSLDSIIALTQSLTNNLENIQNNGMMGYSLSINEGIPNKNQIYSQFKKILVNIQMQTEQSIPIYNAMTLAGQEGFLMLTHIQSKQISSYVLDNGATTSSPTYDDVSFAKKLSKDVFARVSGFYSAGYYMLQFCFQGDEVLAPGNLQTYLRRQFYFTPQILGVVNIDESGFIGCDGGYDYDAINVTVNASKNITIMKTMLSSQRYEHFLNGNTSEVQTGCRINETQKMASDPRIVEIDQNLQGKNFGNNLNKFYGALKAYPFRNSMTVALISGNYDSTNAGEQQCISIRDSSGGVVACNDPPGPQNAAAVACSVILIAIIVGLWVWGCLNVKQEKLKAKNNILRQIDVGSSLDSVQTKSTQIL